MHCRGNEMAVTYYIGGLTRRQLEIVQRACEGKQNKEIAYELHVSLSTIRATLNVIFKRLHVSSRYELLMWAIDNRLFRRGQVEREIFGLEQVSLEETFLN